MIHFPLGKVLLQIAPWPPLTAEICYNASVNQLPLFDEADTPPCVRSVAPSPIHQALARKLPKNLFLGCSSWSFPGWEGLVYEGRGTKTELARHGLAAYAAHPLLTSVGIDRTYYAPLSAAEFADYREAVPEAFRFLVKAHQLCTMAYFKSPTGQSTENPSFLDPSYARDEVVGPYAEGLKQKAGVLVFQFPPQSIAAMGGRDGFTDKLHVFLEGLPSGPSYATEIRNPELLTPRYFEALSDTSASHCFNVHPTMPPLPEQRQLAASSPGSRGAAVVVRWMLRRDRGYEMAREEFAPFNRLVDEDATSRRQIADAIRAAPSRQPVFVIVNNKAEGSAPLTVFRLAEYLADSQ